MRLKKASSVVAPDDIRKIPRLLFWEKRRLRGLKTRRWPLLEILTGTVLKLKVRNLAKGWVFRLARRQGAAIIRDEK